jgi:hypothetical protein
MSMNLKYHDLQISIPKIKYFGLCVVSFRIPGLQCLPAVAGQTGVL